MINMELNITLKCNLACANCNRLCHIYRKRTDHMTLEQINKFILQAQNGGGIKTLKVLGGEPLLHPQFKEIYYMLADAAKVGIIKFIKIETNKTIPIPKLEPFPFIGWKGRIQTKKTHQPILWSPKDLGFDIGPQFNCPQIRKCGYSLDKYGYLPCSMAIMMVRLFNLTYLYKYEFPKEVWGLDLLCQNCIFGMDKQWRDKHGKHLKDFSLEENTPTKTFKEALDKFDEEAFYKNTKEF